MSWKENERKNAILSRWNQQKKTDFMICVAFSHRFLITAKRSEAVDYVVSLVVLKNRLEISWIFGAHMCWCAIFLLCSRQQAGESTTHFEFRCCFSFVVRSFFLPFRSDPSGIIALISNQMNVNMYMHVPTHMDFAYVCSIAKKKSNQRKNNSAETEREQKKSCTTFKLSKRE